MPAAAVIRRRGALLGLLVMAALPLPVQSQGAAPLGDARDGTFKLVRGEVTLVRGSSRRAAVVGGAMVKGDRLLTGAGSAAALTLRDGTVLAVGADSRVELTQFAFDPAARNGVLYLALARGTLRIVTGRIADFHPEQVKVVTPSAVIGVRGTDFIVEQAP